MTHPEEARPRRIWVIDDHDMVIAGVASLLDTVDSLEFSGSTATVDEFLRQGEAADLVVLDLRLGDGSSPTQNVERLLGAGCGVLAFTSGENPHHVRLAAKAGVLGIIRKSAPRNDFVESLVRASNGLPVANSDWASAVDSDPELSQVKLSPKQTRVLELYASGKAAKSVAFELGITEHTVEDYLKQIRAAYVNIGRRANTKVDLYKRALEDGYLPFPEASS
jgi:DNA-binding NarL/FixJ family response regulator